MIENTQLAPHDHPLRGQRYGKFLLDTANHMRVAVPPDFQNYFV